MDPVRFLAAVRARLRRSLVVEGLARVLAIALSAALVAVAADWIWHLPGAVRLALLLAVAGAAGLVAWVRLVRPFRNDLGDAALARFTERRLPALDGRLLTHVEGIPLGAADERSLSAILAATDLRVLVPARRTPRQLLVTGSAVALVVLAMVTAPQLSWDGLRRLLLPLGQTEWSRHTVLRAHLERPVAPSDSALVVAISRGHPDPGFSAPVEVAWRGGRIDESRQLQGLTGTAWSTAIAAAPGTYEITVTSADAPPVELSGRIVNRPSIARITAVLVPPAYTGLPEQKTGTLAGTVVPGTTVRFAVGFAVDPGREITTAGATFDGQTVELGSDPAGNRVGEFTVLKAGTLALTGSDQDGIGLPSEARFPLTITPDRPPVVSLSGPAARETVTVRAVVEVSVAASDDYGLGQVSLRRRTVSGDPDKAKPAAAPAGTPAGEAKPEVKDDSVEAERFAGVGGQTSVTRQAAVTVGSYAAEGEQLVLTARATDRNDVSGPGVGDSEAVMLRVVPEDVLRQELDRLLGEARDRVVQARDELAGAAEPAHRSGNLRSATQGAGKAAELVAQVLRRWDQNRFPADGIAPGRKAGGVLNDAALPHLAEAAATADAPLAAADADLAEAEKLLASILQEGDLTRQLTSLIARQTAINTESRGFVRAFLTRALDPAGKALQANLAGRQRDLSDQALEIEHRLLAKDGSAWKDAQDIVRKSAPGDQLRQAAQDLGTADRRPKAVDGQQEALATLNRLLDALRGGDANKDLAAQLGKLAAEQEALARELERGSAPGALAQKQKDLTERTKAAQREAQAKDPKAGKTLAAATAAQQSAQDGMESGNGAAATRDANAAAGLLREAQEALGGDKDKPKKPDEDQPKKVDVLALLKELRTLQAALVTDATLLNQTAGEKPLAFDAQRQVQTLARTQSDLQLRLTEEGIKPLTENPIAKLALDRVASAMGLAQTQFAKPALGAKGVRLARQALSELSRLIEVAEDMPKPDDKKKEPGGGDANGQAPQAPFPKQAEIALLAAMQQEIAARTAAAHPADLAADQQQLQHLVEAMAATTRPDTRPAVLLERARRAMTSAAFQLKQQDRGALTRNEQQAAEAALRRLLAESGGGGGGGGGGQGGGSKPPPQQSGDGQSPPPQGGDGGGQAAPTQAGGGERKPGNGQATTLPVQAVTTDPGLMELPEQIREQIREAREQHFTPGQLQVYQRYLELLEEAK